MTRVHQFCIILNSVRRLIYALPAKAVNTSMKIIVSKIPDEGVDIHCIETAKSLGVSSPDMMLNGDVHIDAMVTRQGRVFFVDGTLRTSLQLTCGRCAGEFSYHVNTSFYCQEQPFSNSDLDKEAALLKGDMDIEHYAGDEVELNNIFREQVILSTPMHPLCKRDCRGLCPKCGQNLNITNCECRDEEVQSPFSVIKKLFE